MIILEGPDGSGKTTLAKSICTHPDFRDNAMYLRPPSAVLSSSEGPVGSERHLIEWWLDQLIAVRSREYRRKAIYDRTTFISDPIYRLSYGGVPQGTHVEMAYGIQAIAGFADLVVFCLPDFDKTLEVIHAEGRDKLPLSDETLYTIWWAYHYTYQLWKEVAFDTVFLYDWTNGDQLWQAIREAMTRYDPDTD